MQIIKQTSNEIVIGNPPRTVAGTNVGMCLSLSFSFILMMFPFWIAILLGIPEILSGMGITKISCDRPEPKQVNCKISTSKFLGLIVAPEANYRFIKSAKVTEFEEKTNITINGQPLIHRTFTLYLQTKMGAQVALETQDAYLAGTLEQPLNQYFNSQQSFFSITNDSRFNIAANVGVFLPFLISLIVLWLIAWIVIWTTFYSSEISLNKSKKEFIQRENTLFGKKLKRSPLSEIQKIELQGYTDSYNNTSFVPVIVMRSQREQRLDAVTHRDIGIHIANQLRDFLGFASETTIVNK